MSRARNLATILGADGSFGATDVTAALGYTPFNAASAGQLATRGDLVELANITLTGSYSANTWHQFMSFSFSNVDQGQIKGGMYLVGFWVDTHSVGGDSYNMRYSGIVPVGNPSTNATQTNDLVLQRAGHAPNTSNILLRTRLTPGNTDSNIRLDFNTNQAWSNLPSIRSDGRQVFLQVWRFI